jgi:chlorophyllide a reductase subunit Z
VLDDIINAQPVLVRISAAKRLRDQAERDARDAGEAEVSVKHVEKARGTIG